MTTTIQADSFFQICIQEFAEAFGIQDPSQLEAQKRAIVPEYVEIDIDHRRLKHVMEPAF